MSIGTRLYTLLHGELVGTDSFGNRYYRRRGRPLQGRERRWVLYKGKSEASKVPAEWHAWMHHTTDNPLVEQAAQSQPWQKEHLPNLTGTVNAYRPGGHALSAGSRQASDADYEAWKP